MKIFVIKLLVSCVAIYILFQITLGSIVGNLQDSVTSIADKTKREMFKEKIKIELKKGIDKEKYFSEDERVLISQFLKKILKELELIQK